MALRLADVIEEYLKAQMQEHTMVEYGDMMDERKFAEGLEAHLRENFLILQKDLGGKK